MLPTMKVKVLLVSESCSSLVSFDYRKGATLLPLLLLRDAITFPSVVSDWLMFFNSAKCAAVMF